MNFPLKPKESERGWWSGTGEEEAKKNNENWRQ